MVQLRILTGKKAGQTVLATHFPWTIGRAQAADLRLEEAGVWERHLEVQLKSNQGFQLHLLPNALAGLNGSIFEDAALRNGDLIELGPVKVQFWLSETRQQNFQGREWLTWIGLGALSIGQIWLIYWLSRT